MRDYSKFDEKSPSSNSIIHRTTGRRLETLVLPAAVSEIKALSGGWLFNWTVEATHHLVYKLVTEEEPETIQGLISLEKQKDFIFVSLIENAPFNRGKEKKYKVVPGNLFAFACKLSAACDCGGFVVFESKTVLIEHYRKSLGAQSIGNSIRMFIDEHHAQKLIKTHFSKI